MSESGPKPIAKNPGWPERATFLRDRDNFVVSQFAQTRAAIFGTSINLPQEHIDNATRMLLRALYVINLMTEKDTKQTTEKEIVTITVYPLILSNWAVPGRAIPHFTLGETNIHDAATISDADIPNLHLKDVKIELNVRYVLQMLANTDAREKQQSTEGINPAEIEQNKNILLEETAVSFETAAVEELTHARQLVYAAANPQKLTRIIHDLQHYQPLGDTAITKDTKERRRAYEDTLTERKASLWTRSFLRQYYPNSLMYQEEMKIYQRQINKAN